MPIQLNPEQEQIVEQAIRAGIVPAAEDAVELGMATIRQKLETRQVTSSIPDADSWSRQLDQWIKSHSSAAPLLSDEAISRDSIYGTRGQ